METAEAQEDEQEAILDVADGAGEVGLMVLLASEKCFLGLRVRVELDGEDGDVTGGLVAVGSDGVVVKVDDLPGMDTFYPWHRVQSIARCGA